MCAYTQTVKQGNDSDISKCGTKMNAVHANVLENGDGKEVIHVLRLLKMGKAAGIHCVLGQIMIKYECIFLQNGCAIFNVSRLNL